MTHPAVVVDGCWWWRDGYKSLYLLIDMTSLVISYEHLISVVWHVFVKRNQMALRSLGYAIIMFLDIWTNSSEELRGCTRARCSRHGKWQNCITTTSCFLYFMPFLLKQDTGVNMRSEIQVESRRRPTSRSSQSYIQKANRILHNTTMVKELHYASKWSLAFFIIDKRFLKYQHPLQL